MEQNPFSEKKLVIIDDNVFSDSSHVLTLDTNFQTFGESIFISNNPCNSTQLALRFSVYDGFVLKNIFQKIFHLQVALLSSKKEYFEIFTHRCVNLNIEPFFYEKQNIQSALSKIQQKYGVTDLQTLIIQTSCSFNLSKTIESINLSSNSHSLRIWFNKNIEQLPIIQEYYAKTRLTSVSKKINWQPSHKIKTIIIDIDGTCTDGHKIFTSNGSEWKQFNIRDIETLKNWQQNPDHSVFIISGEKGNVIPQFATLCHIPPEHVYLEAGCQKAEILRFILTKHSLDPSEIAYLGDDVNDLGIFEFIIQNNGIGACPSNAMPMIKKIPQIKTLNIAGGSGAVAALIKLIGE